MISGANEEELELANARANILLNCYSSDLETVDKYYEKEIDRLNNIIDELEKYCWELKAMGCREGALDMLDKLKELKENNKDE